MKRLIFFILLGGLVSMVAEKGEARDISLPQPAAHTNTVTWITVNGSIDPTTARFIGRAMEKAKESGAECLVIQLDTPGGLLNATKQIVQHMLGAPVPVVVYVAPEGASAGSAGVFITMAAHFAVMAPTTNIGAAHPVQMGGGTMDTVMREKLVNYAESYIESIAERRNRNVKWAKSAVRSSSSITEDEAVRKNVVDFIAADRQELFTKLDGRTVNGDTLHTRNATVTQLHRTLAEEFLGFLFQPQVMTILLLISIYGILGELSNPGAMFPGIAGAIALILFLYTASAVSINIAGIALIVLALLLFIGEAFTPTFGLLTLGGAVSFFLGGLLLFEDLSPAFQLSWSFLIVITIVTAAFFAFIVSAGIKAQFMREKVGGEAIIGEKGRALERVDAEQGRIFIDGEYWKARCQEGAIEADQWCEVVERNGLTLYVRPLNSNTKDQTQE